MTDTHPNIRQDSGLLVCSVCGGATTELIDVGMPNSMRSDGLVIREPLKKYHCFSCGCLIGRNFQPFVPYFRSNGSSVFDLIRHRAVANGIAKLIETLGLGNAVKVLEVGAASFQTSLQLKETNNNLAITAVEPSPECQPHCNSINIVIADFLSHQFDEKFDVIFSNQVIEHVSDTRAFLTRCSHNLKDDGFILVCCPTSTVASNELLFSDHFFHFTPAAIAQCCSGSGLTLINNFVSSWDPLTHVYVMRKTSANLQLNENEIPAQALFDDRVRLFSDWSAQEHLIEERIDSGKTLLLYGAGEFSQLIRAYLPRIYSRVEVIILDNITGAREFDKPVIKASDSKIGGQQVLIGTHPATREAVKNKLLALGFDESNLITMSV